jgi:hypothetical protein
VNSIPAAVTQRANAPPIPDPRNLRLEETLSEILVSSQASVEQDGSMGVSGVPPAVAFLES